MVSREELVQEVLEKSKNNKWLFFFSKENLIEMCMRLLIGCICIIALVFFGVLSWRIAWSNWNMDLSKFDFSDLLALIMGLFAIAISVAFYFKATDTSNKFYDNVYKFTQETSEILGRIEAGFGERLKHLDEGYAGIRERVERIRVDPVKTEQAIKKEEAEVKKREEERKELLEHLASRAKLQENEKEELFKELRQKDRELTTAKEELRFLQTRLRRSEKEQNFPLETLPTSAIRYISSTIVQELGGPEVVSHLSVWALRRRFNSVKEMFNIDLLKSLELVNKQGELTQKGVRIFRRIAMIDRD
jgi:hypothetical protein